MINTTHEEGTTIHSTADSLLAALADILDHHTTRFELFGGSTDDFIDYPASLMIQSYDVLWTGWQTTSFRINEELHAAITLKSGTIKELRELLVKQTRAHKLGVLEAVAAA